VVKFHSTHSKQKQPFLLKIQYENVKFQNPGRRRPSPSDTHACMHIRFNSPQCFRAFELIVVHTISAPAAVFLYSGVLRRIPTPSSPVAEHFIS